MSSEERSFTAKEVTAVSVFAVLAVLIGIGAYQIGYYRISGTQGGAAMSANTNTAAPLNGQTLYAGNCAGCHGATATGAVGPSLVPTGTWPLPDFKEAMLNGVAPGGKKLSAVMPHFAQQGLDGAPATDEQVKAIHDYLASLK
ncbi:hypothetical protein Dxin01_00361 [Deinococcus xinjiangensis]|uniref:Cytochrome c domain-containing protein n=1 Tax=Deinococcus xinjiangensis TaxID=457454 RepID=A0ABP9V5T9_9DEIO